MFDVFELHDQEMKAILSAYYLLLSNYYFCLEEQLLLKM